jgi:predicted RNA-binding Zn-ribbon protein involved in translation (DUF1610 family)
MVQTTRLLIDHQCPQCGAPIVLEETDHLFSCPYCRVKSFLYTSDFFRFMLPHNAPKGKNLVYLPYWRFKGILFTSLQERIEHRIIDVSHQALLSKVFPASLGLRSQVLKLRFVSPETQGRFLKPDLAFKDMLHVIEKRFSKDLPRPIYTQSFIGETLSQIYAPFYLNGKIYDAVLNRPISSAPAAELDVMALPGGSPSWQIHFIPAQCPTCGWDLEGDRDSIVLYCRNCSSLWTQARKGFRKLEFGHVPGQSREVLYLPFYRILPEIAGIDLRSYADLVRIANLPKVVQKGMEEEPFYFWSPAFKIRPRDFLRFSSAFTLSQPAETWEPRMPAGETYPVTLSIREALESLKINVAGFMKPPGVLLPTLADIQIKARGLSLIYFPFQNQRDEIFHPFFQLRTTRNVLAYARYL